MTQIKYDLHNYVYLFSLLYLQSLRALSHRVHVEFPQ